MLSRRLVITAASLASLLLSGTAQAADEPKGGGGRCTPPTDKWFCLYAEDPGKQGTTTTSGRTEANKPKSQPTDEVSGMPCTYKLADPQPPAGSVEWDGHEPGDGAIYERICAPGATDDAISQLVWAADPPAAQVNPAVVAQRAVDKMLLKAPEIGITPKPGGKGVIGMPVYMWTAKGPETYGPNTASATAGAVTVTATAKVSKIVWAMGDGTTVTCTTAGTPYRAEYGKKPSPDCGHRYTLPSSTQESGKYHVTATSTWTIDWEGGGQRGRLTEVRDSAVDVTVNEVQVLN
ncbi:ATP/GTP-binding protein [Streptomyces sp. NPDC056010]|uniref:ATP/GTP-binding protein n=1 Tax=Streptomyces sp. NPDC056010 TaxID=3345679 RepID=UPI0035DE3A5D